jgi:hypothetical protein
MPTVTITGLPLATSPLASTVEMPVVQDGVTKRAGVATIGFVQSGTGAVLQTIQAKLRGTVNAADYDTLANAKVGAGTTKVIFGSSGDMLSPGYVSISRGGFYEGTLGQLNEPGANNFAKAAQNGVSVFRGTATTPDSTLSYARTGAYVEVHNSTALTQARSVWGNEYKISAITTEHIAEAGCEAEVNGASFRAYSTNAPISADPSKRIMVGVSAIAQTNTGAGTTPWDVFGANIIAAQTSGNAPTNVVGIEVDVINFSSSAGLRPGQVGASNYTAYWAQSDAASGSQSDTAFYASNTATSAGWRQILQAEGKINNWMVYLTTSVNEVSARGIRVETKWQASTGRLLELWVDTNEQMRVDGAADNPVWIRVGSTLKQITQDAADTAGVGFRSLRVVN